VYLFFDESGDYGFPATRLDCYAQAALICPDKLIGEIERFVESRKEAWSMAELHAVDLSSAQLLEVAQFIASSKLYLLASVTDTELITQSVIEAHRLHQAAITKRNLDWYRTESTKVRGAPVPEIEQWMNRMIKRAGLMSQISHGEFVQAQFFVDLVRSALQKAIYTHSLGEWRDDSWDFHFILDAKLPTKRADGEKYLDDMLVPALGSQDDQAIGLLETWKDDPVHPFVRKYSQERGRVRGREIQGAIDLRAIFSEGLRFEPSDRHAGLQLVDTVAYIVRRAVLRPDDVVVQWAYDALRPGLLNEERRAITIQRLGGAEPPATALERYRPLHAEQRQPLP
jgi:Protein of unknown function (DUF3800)